MMKQWRNNEKSNHRKQENYEIGSGDIRKKLQKTGKLLNKQWRHKKKII